MRRQRQGRQGQDSEGGGTRGSKAVGAIARRRQIISTVEAADGEGGNCGAGLMNNVVLLHSINTSNKK